MTPPTSGMQAIAAATFEGNPVVVVFPGISGSGLAGGGGGGGGFDSTGSGMTYIHKLDGSFVKPTSGQPSEFGFCVSCLVRRISS